MRAVVILTMLPLATFASIGMPRLAPVAAPLPVVTVPVTTEGVRRVDMDIRSFNARWLPVNGMPPMTLAAKRVPEHVPGAVDPLPEGSRPHVIRPQPKIQFRPRTTRRESNVCTRHGMHKQVTRGGRSWRCRR
jgi:hypothetical protein